MIEVDAEVQDVIKRCFSDPLPTIEAAQNLHLPEPLDFSPAAVYKTQQGKYVMGFLRGRNWSMEFVEEAALNVENATGLVMVSHCEPLLGMWKSFSRSEIRSPNGRKVE